MGETALVSFSSFKFTVIFVFLGNWLKSLNTPVYQSNQEIFGLFQSHTMAHTIDRFILDRNNVPSTTVGSYI